MIKFLWLLVLAAFACKLLFRKWPWEYVLGTVRSRKEAEARRLLGVSPDASRNEIIEAHRRLLVLVHPDKGGTDEQVIEANLARDVLLTGLTFRKK